MSLETTSMILRTYEEIVPLIIRMKDWTEDAFSSFL